MSDRFAAEISIGGDIPKGCVEGLIAAILQDGPSFGEGEPSIDEEGIRAYLEEGNHVVLYDDQSKYGTFPKIEKCCKEHEIDFNRHSDAKGEHDAEAVFCRNGKMIEFASAQDGTLLIPASRVDGLRVDIIRQLGRSRPMYMDDVIKALEKIAPPVSSLPKARIV